MATINDIVFLSPDSDSIIFLLEGIVLRFRNFECSVSGRALMPEITQAEEYTPPESGTRRRQVLCLSCICYRQVAQEPTLTLMELLIKVIKD